MNSITPRSERGHVGAPVALPQAQTHLEVTVRRADEAPLPSSWQRIRITGRGRVKHPLRRRWAFGVFTVCAAVARWLPLPVAQAVGSFCGYAAYGVLHRYRGLIWEHLSLAFGPSLSRKVRYRISRAVSANVGRMVMEWFVFDRLSPQQLQRLVDIQGLAHLTQALEKGRGAIVLSGHFGNWELMPMVAAALGFQGGVLARPLRRAEYERFLWLLRTRKGVTTIDRGSLKEIARLLQNNQIVGMMPDQDVDSLEGVFVDFLGQSTYTPVGPAALSLMTGASIVPCFITRIGRRFRMVIEEPLAVPRSGDRAQDVVNLTQAWSRVVESYIRCYPDHWMWMHRRWKTRPEQTEGKRTSRLHRGTTTDASVTR